MDKETRVYQITGTPEQLRTLEKVFVHMEFLGDVGATRNILLRIDGDGNARMHFQDADGLYLSDYIKDEKTHNTEQTDGAIVGIYDFE
jgi:hypothetical protein